MKNNISPKILKWSSKGTANILHKFFNEAIIKGKCLLTYNLMLLHKTNYRPISVLQTVSKLYEKLLQQQLNDYIKEHLSFYLCC